MSNTSASGGYLEPAAPCPPQEDDELDDIIQEMIVGITALDGTMVRPRWQTTVPKQPEPSIDWCAFSINEQEPDANPVMVHQGDANGGLGQDQFIRHEEMTILASFYGPRGRRYASQLRDGIYVTQNSEFLHQYLIGVIGAGVVRAAPEFINQQWVRRFDIDVKLRRQIVRTYAVENLVSAPSELYTDPEIIIED